MNTSITYTSCPACQSTLMSKVLVCRDHTVSREDFEIWECSDCQVRFTQHIPDAEAIGRYYQSDNYISHSDTGQGIINKLYKLARKFTLISKRKLVTTQTGLTKGKLLDVGCGTGAFLATMKQANWQVTGLEPDAGAREKVRHLYGIAAMQADELFHLAPNSFDAITMWHVLEHVHDLHGYLEQFKSILTSKGRLFIAVPNYTATDANHYEANWAAYDVPRHLYHFSPKSMGQLALQHGFIIKAIKPMLLDAFYVAMLSEQYKNGKGNLIQALWQGLSCLMATIGDTKKSSSLVYILEKQA
jgi:2-polyprenyl-3-methyl-5-hydroxy-6-metoxy-1,4-benzoquinol methylase